MKRLCIVGFFLLQISFLFASPYGMIPVGDPVLDDLLFLSLESGRSFLSFTPPLSPDEISQFLDSIDISFFSSSAREAYDRVRNRLSPHARLNYSSNNFILHLNAISTLEFISRFNTDISFEPFYYKTPALLSLQFNFFFTETLQIYFEPAAALSPQFYRDPYWHNIPLEAFDFDMSFPNRAFIALGGSWWNFQLGRDRLSYGTGEMGNLTVSDNPDFYDFARLSLFTNTFKYSLLISQMPLEIRDQFYNLTNPNALRSTTQRYFYFHRIDINLFNRFSIGLMEGVMVGNSPLELRFMNPAAIFHSMFSWWNYDEWAEGSHDRRYMVGSLFSFEINWNIIRSLAFHGQFVMNEFSIPHKSNIEPNQSPNGLGYMAGLRYSHSSNTWASVFNLEFIYTDPYLYLNPTPFASLIHMRYYSMAPGRLGYSYMGYPRDTISLNIGADFFIGDMLSIKGAFTWHSRGEHNKNGLVWDWERSAAAFNETTPTGISENTYIASISSQWKLNPYFTLNGNMALVYQMNNRHVTGINAFGGQAAFSIAVTY